MGIKYSVQTSKGQELVNITDLVRKSLEESGVMEGSLIIFVPHTTAAVTLNENADPDVLHDVLLGLNKAFPEGIGYRHREGNSHAHIMASAFGSSVTVIIENGRMLLGTWQDIYLCEFDGPRARDVFVKISKD